jgi:competence protein ComGC
MLRSFDIPTSSQNVFLFLWISILLILIVPDEEFAKNTTYALNLISAFFDRACILLFGSFTIKRCVKHDRLIYNKGHRGRNRMVVGFTTAYAISAHHY